MTEINPISRKRKLSFTTPNQNKCICHVENFSGPLISFFEKSWNTFERCAKRQKDAKRAQLEGYWQDGPSRGHYHRKCFQVYTDKSKVARAGKLQQNVIHSVSRGRIKTPKHGTLPLKVKSLRKF